MLTLLETQTRARVTIADIHKFIIYWVCEGQNKVALFLWQVYSWGQIDIYPLLPKRWTSISFILPTRPLKP